MSRQTSVFLLLLTICIAAGSLAIFVHDLNTTLAPLPAPTVITQPQTPSNPLRIDQTATTTRPDEFVSADGVMHVAGIEEGQLLSNPFRFSGTTTAFENQANWELRQAGGKVIGRGNYYVHSPDVGIPGPFSVEGFYDTVPTTSTGELAIFEASAKDGSPIHLVTIPVRLEVPTTTKMEKPKAKTATSP